MTSSTWTDAGDLREIDRACQRALRLMQAVAPVKDVLSLLADAAENMSGSRSAVSILVLDKEGLLRNGASPNLPADYLHAIDRLKPDPQVGTCAAAAATGDVVVTSSFLEDSKWAELRHLPLALGFVGAWSTPIRARAGGAVLGTFGTYYRDVREPSPHEIEAVTRLADVAAKAIEKNAGLQTEEERLL